jgi:hypothetical protein
MVLVWVVVVVAVSGVTWAVIQSAGRDVLRSGEAVTLPEDGLTSESASPSATPERTPRSAPTVDASDGTSPTEASPSPVPSSATPSPRQSQSTDAPGSAGAQPQVRSWQGAAGTVTARCVGSRISLVSASPNNGWRIDVEGRGPQEVEVEFETGGDNERRTKVEGRCADGIPRFEAETDD